MRPLFAIGLSILLIGGIFAYTRFAERVRPAPSQHEIDFSDATFSIVIRKTFDAAPDPISGTDALSVRFQGRIVHSAKTRIAANQTVTIPTLADVEIGENEIMVEANHNSTNDSEDELLAMQVEIQQNGDVIASKIFTNADQFPIVGGPVVFLVEPTHVGELPEAQRHSDQQRQPQHAGGSP